MLLALAFVPTCAQTPRSVAFVWLSFNSSATFASVAIKPSRGQGVLFLLWPLFARAPRHWFLENVLLSAPGVQSVFFVALRWAPRPFGGARAKKKKNTTQGVFFAPAPGKGKGRRSPVGRRHGARAKKKHHPGCFFFAAAPAKSKGRRSPVGRRHGARAKKKNTTQGVFFAPAPGKDRGRRSSPSLAFRRGRSKKKKKTPWVVFFFCSGPVPAPNGASPSLAFRQGRSQKKTPWVVFFVLLRPRADAHSLTAGLGGDASPSPGWCFFFCCGPARTGVVIFFLLWPRRDAHSLTVGWGDFGKDRVVFFFFLLRPRRVFLDNNKKCLGYYIGSKKTRRGHSKKKTPLPPQGLHQPKVRRSALTICEVLSWPLASEAKQPINHPPPPRLKHELAAFAYCIP